jgi:hypothetical protein
LMDSKLMHERKDLKEMAKSKSNQIKLEYLIQDVYNEKVCLSLFNLLAY